MTPPFRAPVPPSGEPTHDLYCNYCHRSLGVSPDARLVYCNALCEALWDEEHADPTSPAPVSEPIPETVKGAEGCDCDAWVKWYQDHDFDKRITATEIRDREKEMALLSSEVQYLDAAFTYHPPKADQPARYEALRAMGRQLAREIIVRSRPSRERSLALTKLEEALMWANAGIARNG